MYLFISCAETHRLFFFIDLITIIASLYFGLKINIMESQPTVHKYSISLVTQGLNKFYTLTVPTDILGRTCFVTTREDDPKQGFQRLLDQKRAQEIADYIDSGGSIPSAIILSAQPEAELEIIGKGKTLKFVDHPKAFLVLDGQHRVFGFSIAKSSIRVPVVIYNGLTRRDESRIFIDINTKQRPVPNELLFDIKSLAEYETETEGYLNAIFTLFHEEPDSPLIGLTVAASKSRKKISRVTFYNAFRPILKFLANKDPNEVYEIVKNYLRSFYKGLNKRHLGLQLTNTVVFRATISLFPSVARRVKDRYNDYNENSFDEILNPLFQGFKDNKVIKPGLSYKELTDYFETFIDSNFTL